MNKTFTIEESGINLTQAIKLNGLADNGGHAKALIAEGQVKVNGTIETRKKRQLVAGDVVEVNLG